MWLHHKHVAPLRLERGGPDQLCGKVVSQPPPHTPALPPRDEARRTGWGFEHVGARPWHKELPSTEAEVAGVPSTGCADVHTHHFRMGRGQSLPSPSASLLRGPSVVSTKKARYRVVATARGMQALKAHLRRK